ncbi:hypothetical protein QR680_008453 [Steinernema hermaphroditum]|uniref:protein-serine/threonine phosphatase n=1 Tax=Steinernema hermaphroditum TaxID=289476 RepID=A0AA39II03_9BILA|nr:hypothetical protein QR680_008453 [Steinernema hermaphroditum]
MSSVQAGFPPSANDPSLPYGFRRLNSKSGRVNNSATKPVPPPYYWNGANQQQPQPYYGRNGVQEEKLDDWSTFSYNRSRPSPLLQPKYAQPASFPLNLPYSMNRGSPAPKSKNPVNRSSIYNDLDTAVLPPPPVTSKGADRVWRPSTVPPISTQPKPQAIVKPIFPQKQVVWSVPIDPDKPTQQPKVHRLMPSGTVYDQRSIRMTNRLTKPRLPRFFQSLCCCIRPNSSKEKKRIPAGKAENSATSIITQVAKNGHSAGVGQSLKPDVTDGIIASALPNGTTVAPSAAPDILAAAAAQIKPCEKLLLPPPRPSDVNKKCLIIDLDETLVHSSFKPVKNADFVIPVEIDNVIHQVYVLKRPYVDEFLEKVGPKYECVLFTASLAKYADPVADLLDKHGVFRSRLFREACVFSKGNYVKDLARLGRDLKQVLIVDNSPASYAFHPENAIPVQTWFDDPDDIELLDILPLLDQIAEADNVYSVLNNSNDDLNRSSSLEYPECR